MFNEHVITDSDGQQRSYLIPDNPQMVDSVMKIDDCDEGAIRTFECDTFWARVAFYNEWYRLTGQNYSFNGVSHKCQRKILTVL